MKYLDHFPVVGEKYFRGLVASESPQAASRGKAKKWPNIHYALDTGEWGAMLDICRIGSFPSSAAAATKLR